MKHIAAVGGYFIMLYDVFRKRTRWSITKDLILREIDDLIFGSIGIVAFISFFVGGVVAVQTFTAVILAGKIGSFITSSIGTMRVTEQIDALDIMGVNSVNYLIFPKIVALMLMPFLIALGMYLGVLGGWASAVMSGYTTSAEFVQGVQYDFKPYSMVYAFTKTIVFAFFLATIPSYHGYYMKGGALDVGKASTVSFVWTSIVIILANSVLTQLFYA